jgi:cytochrome c biogenesis protein CcmG/thiol:disulfide interchange protein DsbE
MMEEVSLPVKRNTIVLGVTLLILATFAWAGWANWEYRRQQSEKAAASAVQATLEKGESADAMYTSSPLVGKPAPDFKLQDLAGRQVTLADYKGKALLINFWATWCGPCKLETPWIVELRNQYADKGFEVLGVDSEGDDLKADDKDGFAKQKESVAKFVKLEKMPYPVLLNGDSIAKQYGGLDAMPTSFWVDRSGKVVAAQMGITSKDDMEEKIRKALQ